MEWGSARWGDRRGDPQRHDHRAWRYDLWLSTPDGEARPPIAVGSPLDGPDASPSLAQGSFSSSASSPGYPGAMIVLLSIAATDPEVQDTIDAVVTYYATGGAGAAPGVRVLGFADGLTFPQPDIVEQRDARPRRPLLRRVQDGA